MFLLLIFVLLLIYIIYFFLDKIELQNLSNRAVFITGCDSGFGYGLALKCLQRGMPVFAGCFTETGADNLRKIGQKFTGKLEIIMVDVGNDQSVAKAAKVLEEKTKPYGGLHGVVNNAGIVGSAFVDDLLTVEDYKKTAEVNVWGVIRVTHAVKDLIKKTKGRIVVVTSICARVAIPANAPYTVSKHAASGYCDTLRKEMKPWGVKVCVLEPGFFNTPLTDIKNVGKVVDAIWEKTDPKRKEEYGYEFVVESKERLQKFLERIGSDKVHLVVNDYFHALTARFPRPRYQVGNDSKYLWRPLSLLPTRLQDAFFRLGDVSLGQPLPAALKH